MSENYNIEEEFLQIKDLKSFPKSKDYVSIYKIFVENFKNDIHREINTKLKELEKDGYFNDHGIAHIKTVIRRASDFIKNHQITPYETFLLLMAIQLHDAGHIISSRSEHAKMGKRILAKFDKGNLLTSFEKVHIGNIAKAHGGKDDPINKLPSSERLEEQEIRPQLLAAILRLSDELAEERERASNFILQLNNERKEGEGPLLSPNSEIFHLFSASVSSYNFCRNEVLIELYTDSSWMLKMYPKPNGTEKFLLDEIYERTLKTFTESIYCNRFLPENCRVNIIRVNIHIYDENHDEIKKIGYVLKESGYPLLEEKDIFERCSSLKESEHNLDGKFIKQFIENYESIRS